MLTQAWPSCSLTPLKQGIYAFCSHMCCLTLHCFFSLHFHSFRLCCDCPTQVTFTCSLLLCPCCVFKPLVFLSSLCQCNFPEACCRLFTHNQTPFCVPLSSDAIWLWPPAVFLCLNEYSQAEFIQWLASLFGSLACFFFSFSRAGLMFEGATHSHRQNSSTVKHSKDASPICVCNTFPLYSPFFKTCTHNKRWHT